MKHLVDIFEKIKLYQLPLPLFLYYLMGFLCSFLGKKVRP